MATTTAPPLLDFNTAMSDFTVMFPTRSRDEIEEVLWRNKGAIQASIDDLLEKEEREKKVAAPTRVDLSSIQQRRQSSQSRSSTEESKQSTSLPSVEEIKKESWRVKKKIMENECKLTFEFNGIKRNALLSEQKALLAQEREYSRFIAREERRKKEKRSKSVPRKKEEKKDIVDTVLHLSAASRKRWDSFVRGISAESSGGERKKTTNSID
ncbi:hypothetical protein PRIPAC_93379 [Pristionchus pacificus]|uniref:CUE domain-containing protein n=1 Tax=Pristionchus pacificus TaxID=54126 RepID=A0A2A6B9X1_PRIPA|nr:hypothetical protein PRIPAC_93379 [Pristionchus pacificus]|eukprot:PDM62651.1 hypothetical protein PRIPAC_49866 [Pristionchus pacificus]